MIQKKSGVRATVSLSFQVRARGSNTQLTLKKWADASGLGTGPPQRLLATRKSRCFASTGLNHQDKLLLKGNCFCKGRSSKSNNTLYLSHPKRHGLHFNSSEIRCISQSLLARSPGLDGVIMPAQHSGMGFCGLEENLRDNREAFF